MLIYGLTDPFSKKCFSNATLQPARSLIGCTSIGGRRDLCLLSRGMHEGSRLLRVNRLNFKFFKI